MDEHNVGAIGLLRPDQRAAAETVLCLPPARLWNEMHFAGLLSELWSCCFMGDPVMPRYFFHLSFGERTIRDEEGVELPSRSAARADATASIRELTNPKTGNNSRRWAGWFLEVSDDGGQFLRLPIGHPALEIVSPDGDRLRPEVPKLEPVLLAATTARGRTTEIVRQIATSRERTAQLLRDYQHLRRELLSVYLASKDMRGPTDRLVAIARGAEQILRASNRKARPSDTRPPAEKHK